MTEKQDPYFEQRLQTGRNHQILRTIDMSSVPFSEVESNKEIPNPIVEGSIEDFGWSKKSVENIIDAIENNKIKVELLESNRIRVELLPIEELPAQFGHISELDIVRNNLKEAAIFGSKQPDQLTYLQTVDFAVEGYMDDEREGKEYGRIYVDVKKLLAKRNVYIDPESLHVTDYEYGYSYCVKGGVPFEAIIKVDVIRAKKVTQEGINNDTEIDTTPDSIELLIQQQTLRLKEYLALKSKNHI